MGMTYGESREQVPHRPPPIGLWEFCVTSFLSMSVWITRTPVRKTVRDDATADGSHKSTPPAPAASHTAIHSEPNTHHLRTRSRLLQLRAKNLTRTIFNHLVTQLDRFLDFLFTTSWNSLVQSVVFDYAVSCNSPQVLFQYNSVQSFIFLFSWMGHKPDQFEPSPMHHELSLPIHSSLYEFKRSLQSFIQVTKNTTRLCFT